MLLEFPNPKDPQDAEVAKLSLEQPERFARTAHDWAVKYAGAPRQDIDFSKYNKDDGKPKAPTGVECVFPLPLSLPRVHHVCKELGNRMSYGQKRLLTRDYSYKGYNKDLIDRFVHMGFPVNDVVDAFCFVGIDRNDGEDYELEEAYMGDITARLLGEN